MLALALGRTIQELQAAMGQDEFEAWKAYYRLWPFDDYHRFHRPAGLVAASMSGELEAKLDWLAGDRIKAPELTEISEVDRSVMAALGG